MAANDPAVEWWETDPESPGRLEHCDIEFTKRCDPSCDMAEFTVFTATGATWFDTYTRPMFEVLPQ